MHGGPLSRGRSRRLGFGNPRGSGLQPCARDVAAGSWPRAAHGCPDRRRGARAGSQDAIGLLTESHRPPRRSSASRRSRCSCHTFHPPSFAAICARTDWRRARPRPASLRRSPAVLASGSMLDTRRGQTALGKGTSALRREQTLAKRVSPTNPPRHAERNGSLTRDSFQPTPTRPPWAGSDVGL